jgi:hypothetical protein
LTSPAPERGAEAILDSHEQLFPSNPHLIHTLENLKDTEDETNMAGEKTPHFETLQLHAGKED